MKLTDEYAAEIYYALLSKVNAIEKGYYDPEDNPGENEEWIELLDEIIEAIGEDGKNLTDDDEPVTDEERSNGPRIK